MIYKKVKETETTRPLPIGHVLHWGNDHTEAVSFTCKCGQREVYVQSPPHTILFDEEDKLTVEGSCGQAATEYRPQNWCHFQMTDGEITMYNDAKCPGIGDIK